MIDHIPQRWEIAHADGHSYEAIGFAKDGELVGGVVYYYFTGLDIEATAAGLPGWLTPAHVKQIFDYPFIQLGCRRLTATVARRNKKSRRFVERLGFKLEGVRRKALKNGQDEMSYGLLKEECKWI